MADPYTQASMNPMDPAALQAAADAFQRQEAMATLAEISGDPVLGRVGAGMRERASERRRGLSRAREAAQKRQQIRPSGMPGFYIQGNEMKRVPGYDKYLQEQHQRGLELARARGRAGGMGDWMARQQYKQQYMNPTEWNKAAEGLSWIQQLGETIPEVAAAGEDIAQPSADIAAEMAGNVGLAGPARALESQYRSEASRSIRTRIKKVINSVRASEFGAALTAMEKPEFAAVDPLAPGLTKDQMLRRLRDMVRGLVTTARIQVGGRMGPGGQMPPPFLQEGYDWMQAPIRPSGATPPQTPPVTAQPQGPPPPKPPGISEEEYQEWLQAKGYTPS